VVYHDLIAELNKQHVIFSSIEAAMHKYPKLVQRYFGKLVSHLDNKYAALNTAV
jgi:Fe-S cluster assembly protein SufB